MYMWHFQSEKSLMSNCHVKLCKMKFVEIFNYFQMLQRFADKSNWRNIFVRHRHT